MSLYNIAGVTVSMTPRYETLTRQSEAYRFPEGKTADMELVLPDGYLAGKQQENPHLSMDDCEYIWYGFEFYRRLPRFGGIMLHSSCIAVDGEAYLFSAPSGTGKSTHTALWKKRFGDRALYINDDKPALCVAEGKIEARGTPFSGKTDWNTNLSVPVKGICVLERGEKNRIYRANTEEVLPKLLNQVFRPQNPQDMIRTLEILDAVLASVPVYRLYCNISDEAAALSYQAMHG